MTKSWELNMTPNSKFVMTPMKSIHILSAAMDEGDKVKLNITADETKFFMATLNQDIPRMSLNLNIKKGKKIIFQTTGNAWVQLTGYVRQSDESDDQQKKGQVITNNNEEEG